MESTAEEMLMVAEERIQTKLRAIEVSLVNTSAFLREQYLEHGASPEEIEDYLVVLDKNFRTDKEYFQGYNNVFLYLPGEGEGIFFYGVGGIPPADHLPEIRPWCIVTNTSPGTVVPTVPYRDSVTGEMIISIVMEIQNDRHETSAFFGINIALETIAEYVISFRFEKGGYGYLIGPISETDPSLCFISYPNPQYKWIPLGDLGPQYKDLEEQLRFGSEKISSLNILNKTDVKVIAFYRKTFNGWYVGLAFPRATYFRDVYIMTFIYSVIGIIMMVVLCYFLLHLSIAKIHSDEENKAKSSFLAQVSHEIRTPLNSILGMSEILQRKNISAEIYEDVSIIKQAGNILLSIINNILDFSKIQTNKVLIETHPYNLASMMNDVVNVIRLRLMDKPADFFVSLDSKIPAELIGDELKIRQLLINLLNNAVKYTQKGYIKLSVEKESININTIKLIFNVEDTGIGIKQEDIAILFQDFARVDTEHNYGIEGSGLGLTIANSFCKAMGGSITVISTYGKGSIFTAAIIQSFEKTKKIAQLENSGKRVVVYEDRRTYLDSLLTAFGSLGMQPKCAQDLPSFMQDLIGAEFDFAFVSSHFAADCISKWGKSGSAVRLIVMTDSDDMSGYHSAGSMHLPVYSCVLANVLNGVHDAEKTSFRLKQIGFIAPEARVLVVDDLATNLQVAEGLMAPYKMDIDTCISGSEAFIMVKKHRYDLVFMDHMMPEMDGLFAAGLIRKLGRDDKYFQHLPIVMLTANAVSGQREIFLKNGINDFLPKPIDVHKLNTILETWIPKEKQQKLNEAPEEKISDETPIPEISGIHVETGMMNTGGSVSSYKHILSFFYKDTEERIPQIKKTAEAGEFLQYTTMVHAIKGAARSIGATELGQMAADLEAAGNERNTTVINEKTDEFLKELRQLADRVKAALAETAKTEQHEDVLEASQVELETLKEALDNMDTGKINKELGQLITRQLNHKTRKFFNTIEQCVLLFEYEKAIKLIDETLLGEES
ncbi:MAG: response regulator [Treponema sp.]|nr:response regulator [Treponema sp.]